MVFKSQWRLLPFKLTYVRNFSHTKAHFQSNDIRKKKNSCKTTTKWSKRWFSGTILLYLFSILKQRRGFGISELVSVLPIFRIRFALLCYYCSVSQRIAKWNERQSNEMNQKPSIKTIHTKRNKFDTQYCTASQVGISVCFMFQHFMLLNNIHNYLMFPSVCLKSQPTINTIAALLIAVSKKYCIYKARLCWKCFRLFVQKHDECLHLITLNAKDCASFHQIHTVHVRSDTLLSFRFSRMKRFRTDFQSMWICCPINCVNV